MQATVFAPAEQEAEPAPGRWADVAWIGLALGGLAAMLVFQRWAVVILGISWVSFLLVRGTRGWAANVALGGLAVMGATTGTGVVLIARDHLAPLSTVAEAAALTAACAALLWRARLHSDGVKGRTPTRGRGNALDRQRRFLQDVAHQLGTPILIALGHAQLMERDLADHPSAGDLRIVIEELQRLRRIGARLLVIVAADDPDFLHPEPVSLPDFVTDLVARWAPAAQRRWRVGHLDETTVWADRERLGLAVDALIENAIRHTKERGTILVSVHAEQEGPFARLVVADDGTGIDPAELPHVFDRFRTGAGEGGTGLGLALVAAIAHAHGGTASARSAPGAGSTFTLELPAVPSEPAAEHPAAPGGVTP